MNTPIQGKYMATPIGKPKQITNDSKVACISQGSLTSTTVTSLLNLFNILPLGLLSKNFIFENIILEFNFLNNE